MTPARHRRALLASALVLAVSACGVRGEPRPPEDTAPIIPGSVEATREDDSTIVVRWNRAVRSADGERLTDLVAFTIDRSRDGADVWEKIATIDVVDQDKIRPRRDFSFRDEGAGPEAAVYRVRAVCSDGQQGPPREATAPPAD